MAPVVIVAELAVLGVRLAAAMKAATDPAAIQVPAPVTLAEPGPVSVKVVELIEPGVIATLKVALRAWLMGTPVAPLTGTVAMTVGWVWAGTVLKVHT